MAVDKEGGLCTRKGPYRPMDGDGRKEDVRLFGTN